MLKHAYTPKQKLIFEISGEVKLNLEESEVEGTFYKNDEEQQVLTALKKEEWNINREIQEEIQTKLNKHSQVEISFENGSILATGLIVMEFLGTIADTVSFFEYTSRFIKFITERAIRSRMNQKTTRKTTISIQVTPYTYANVQSDETLQSNSSNNENTRMLPFNISPSQLLVYITLINIIFFLGGTLFNIFQINSIQQRFNDANQKYDEVKTKYDSASQLVAYAKIKYQNELENIVSDVLNKKTAILSHLSSDTITISSNVSLLNEKIKRYSLLIENLNQEVTKSDRALDKLNDNIERLQNKKVKFNVWDIWKYMTWDLRIMLLVINILPVIMLFLIFTGRIGHR